MLVNHKIQIFLDFSKFHPKAPIQLPGQDARVRFRPLPGFYVFFCRLEMSARGRGYRPGQGLRRGIQLRFREMAKSIAAGPELAVGSNS